MTLSRLFLFFSSILIFSKCTSTKKNTNVTSVSVKESNLALGNIEDVQKFVLATVQIPYQAKVAKIQSNVLIRAVFSNDTTFSTSIVRSSQRTDCDNEALRVVGLINPQNLKAVLGGNTSGMIEVPFMIESPIFRENGYEVTYFDQDKRPIFEPSQAKYFKQFKVDTLSGVPFGDILYFEKGKKEPVFKENFVIDSSQVYRPGVLEDPLQKLKIYETRIVDTKQYMSLMSHFKNGVLRQKFIQNVVYLYYPNGSISNIYVNQQDSNTGEQKSLDTRWFYNGQLAFIRIRRKGQPEEYLSVWNTKGKQLVTNGNGLDEYYEGSGKNLIKISGHMKNGYREGTFKATNLKNEVVFKGVYSRGFLMEGLSYEQWIANQKPN